MSTETETIREALRLYVGSERSEGILDAYTMQQAITVLRWAANNIPATHVVEGSPASWLEGEADRLQSEQDGTLPVPEIRISE